MCATSGSNLQDRHSGLSLKCFGQSVLLKITTGHHETTGPTDPLAAGGGPHRGGAGFAWHRIGVGGRFVKRYFRWWLPGGSNPAVRLFRPAHQPCLLESHKKLDLGKGLEPSRRSYGLRMLPLHHPRKMVHGEGFEPSSLAYRASGLPLDEPWNWWAARGSNPSCAD